MAEPWRHLDPRISRSGGNCRQDCAVKTCFTGLASLWSKKIQVKPEPSLTCGLIIPFLTSDERLHLADLSFVNIGVSHVCSALVFCNALIGRSRSHRIPLFRLPNQLASQNKQTNVGRECPRRIGISCLRITAHRFNAVLTKVSGLVHMFNTMLTGFHGLFP